LRELWSIHLEENSRFVHGETFDLEAFIQLNDDALIAVSKW